MKEVTIKMETDPTPGIPYVRKTICYNVECQTEADALVAHCDSGTRTHAIDLKVSPCEIRLSS